MSGERMVTDSLQPQETSWSSTNAGVIVFLSLALGLALLAWLLSIGDRRGLLRFHLNREIFGALCGYGPTIAAVVAATVIRSGTGLSQLGHRLIAWRMPMWLAALALLGPFAVMALERSKNSNALKWHEFLPVLGCVANWLPQASAA